MANNLTNITITRSRDLGTAGTISVTLVRTEPIDRDTAMVAFINLTNTADELMDAYLEAEGIKKTINPEHGAGVRSSRWVTANGISVTMKDGKRVHKVKGGEFSEHGINFWPEHMKANGIDPKLIPDESYVFKQATEMLVEFIDGKPKRVLELRKVCT